MALEPHIEKPDESSAFQKFPKVLAKPLRHLDDLRLPADGGHECGRSQPDRRRHGAGTEEDAERGTAWRARTADHGGRSAGARYRRGGAGRDQDDVAYRSAACGPRRHDRQRAVRHVPRRAAGLWAGRPVRLAAEGSDRGGGEILRGDPRRAGDASARQRAAGQRGVRVARWCRTSTCRRSSGSWRRRLQSVQSQHWTMRFSRLAHGPPRPPTWRSGAVRRQAVPTRPPLFLGLRAVGVFHRAEAADRVGQLGDRHGNIQRIRAQCGERGAQVADILLDQRRARSCRSCWRPNRSNARAAQVLAMPQHAEQRQRQPAWQRDLAATTGRRIDAGDQRRRQVEHRLVAIRRRGVQARDFVFVLVRHHAIQPFRGRA